MAQVGGGGRRPRATLALRAERPRVRSRTARPCLSPVLGKAGPCTARGRAAVPAGAGAAASRSARPSALQLRRAGVRAYVCMRVRACACVSVCAHTAPGPWRPSLLGAAVPRPRPFPTTPPARCGARLHLQPLGWKICPATAGAGGAERRRRRAQGERSGRLLTAAPPRPLPRRKVHCQATGLARGLRTPTLRPVPAVSSVLGRPWPWRWGCGSASPSPDCYCLSGWENDPRVDKSLVLTQGKKKEVSPPALHPLGSHCSFALATLPLPHLQTHLARGQGEGCTVFHA